MLGMIFMVMKLLWAVKWAVGAVLAAAVDVAVPVMLMRTLVLVRDTLETSSNPLGVDLLDFLHDDSLDHQMGLWALLLRNFLLSAFGASGTAGVGTSGVVLERTEPAIDPSETCAPAKNPPARPHARAAPCNR